MATVLIYATAVTAVEKRLVEALESSKNDLYQENFRTLENLKKRLRLSIIDDSILILLPENSKELSGLIEIRDILRDTRIILVLPDDNEATLSKGHNLRPRFISYRDGNFTDVAAVMSKMIQNNGKESILIN